LKPEAVGVSTPLLTIGAFARAVGLTPSALRHYDECGLLRPAEVDDATGYRYYTPELVRRAEMIAQLRAAGVPIETMRVVLDGSPAEAERVLREHVEAQAAKTARAETAVAQMLASVESEPKPAGAARLSVVGSELAAAIRQVRPAADHDVASPLGSVLIDACGDTLDVVATNRFWMAVRSLPVGGPAADVRLILGVPDALELADGLAAAEEVALTVGDGRVEVEGLEFADRDVAYPAHRVVVDGLEPKRTVAVLSKAELVAAIEAIGRSEVVLEVADAGPTIGAGDDPPRGVAGAVRGAAIAVRMGSALLLRALTTTLGDEVRLEISASDRPVLVRSPYQSGFVALVMPAGPA
jgi:DNA polymerase-3 subunit beta